MMHTAVQYKSQAAVFVYGNVMRCSLCGVLGKEFLSQRGFYSINVSNGKLFGNQMKR